ELVRQVLAVSVLDGISNLVCLLDRVRRNGGEGLLTVPGAAMLRVAQPRHERKQFLECALCLAHGASAPTHTRYSVCSMPAVAPQMRRSPNGISRNSTSSPVTVRCRCMR